MNRTTSMSGSLKQLERILTVFSNCKVPASQIEGIRKKSAQLGYFPLFYAIDCYLNSCDETTRQFATLNSYIYIGNRPDKIDKTLSDSDKKGFNKLRYWFGIMASGIRRLMDMDSLYKDLYFHEINRQESTSFTKSFVYWVLWKFGHAMFLGENSHQYPSWCFSENCVEMCFVAKPEYGEGFRKLYLFIANALSVEREKDLSADLSEFLRYEEDIHTSVFTVDGSGTVTSKRLPNIIHTIPLSDTVLSEINRIARFVGHGVHVNDGRIIIKQGPAHLIPIEKPTVGMSVEQRVEEIEKKIVAQKLEDSRLVTPSPIVNRFVSWVESQEWYDEWSALYQKYADDTPFMHLHSLGVAKKLNNSTPARRLIYVLDQHDFPFSEERNKYTKASDDFIKTDREPFVQQIEQQLSQAENGLLVMNVEDIYKLFGLDSLYINIGVFILLESLALCKLSYGPVDFKEHICIYREQEEHDLIKIHNQLTYSKKSLLSLLLLASRIVSGTELQSADIGIMDLFLNRQRLKAPFKRYCLACFVIYSRHGAKSYSYNFSKLSSKQKTEYYSCLEELANSNTARIKQLQKYKDKLA